MSFKDIFIVSLLLCGIVAMGILIFVTSSIPLIILSAAGIIGIVLIISDFPHKNVLDGIQDVYTQIIILQNEIKKLKKEN